MESYTTILVVLLILFVFIISWVFFGKVVVLKFVSSPRGAPIFVSGIYKSNNIFRLSTCAVPTTAFPYGLVPLTAALPHPAPSNISLISRANSQDAYEAQAAAAIERAQKRAETLAAKEEAARKAEEEKALQEAAAICPNCKVNHGSPSAVSDVTDYMDCCERHKQAKPHKTVFSVASTESTV
ncbi:hypothetical protein ONS96_006813 [Cadophora gregata f. sp. sojae]|nr:hypothetical protein ONS96_006813 [Cadophora gregata f. sp. sojae]